MFQIAVSKHCYDMVMDTPVTYDCTDGVATITLDDGKVNALSVPTLGALHDALDRAERDDAVVLLTGRPGCFSAGFDLATFAAGAEPLLQMLTLGARLVERLLAFPAPVVVACTGTALAAGAFPTLAADVRFAADAPYDIGLNEVRIGLTVPAFVVELARHRLAPAHLQRAVTCAELYRGDAAATAGFVDEVVPASELAATARATAIALTHLDRTAYVATQAKVRGDVIARVRAAIDDELAREGFGLAAA